eukprot:544781-Pyramimonas_sp.AAC.1
MSSLKMKAAFGAGTIDVDDDDDQAGDLYGEVPRAPRQPSVTDAQLAARVQKLESLISERSPTAQSSGASGGASLR